MVGITVVMWCVICCGCDCVIHCLETAVALCFNYMILRVSWRAHVSQTTGMCVNLCLVHELDISMNKLCRCLLCVCMLGVHFVYEGWCACMFV